jgi:cytoskeletal protein RodZ
MDNLGSYLRQLREEKGKTHKTVFEELRLRPEQVQKIEDNRYFELGPFGVVKAMVYNYARYLDADLDAVMAEFRVMMPDNTKKEFKPKKVVREKKILLSPNLFWMIGIALFVVVLAAVLWHSYNQGWLKMPELFKASAADTTVTHIQKKEPVKPDTLRLRMRALTVNAEQHPAQKPASRDTVVNALQDSTDYLGGILGSSQVNVPLH